jgi:hypothetical protein
VGLVNSVDETLVYHEMYTTIMIQNDIEMAKDTPTIRKSGHALFIIIRMVRVSSESPL